MSVGISTFLPPGERVDRLARTVYALDELLGDENHVPRAEQRPRPPLLIGGNGDRMPLPAVGAVREIGEQLRDQRERYGFTYLSVLDPYMAAPGPVIEEPRGT